MALTTKRRQAGTTLVEILVVIVIFLIGILAVVQVFPRGFRLLLTTRNNSMATALGRDAVERYKSNPSLIPDQIVSVRYSGGVPIVDTSIDPLSLAPLGDSISAAGTLTNGGATVRNDWMLAAGPNVARRIVGEGQRLPAARQVGPVSSDPTKRFESYGSLMVLDHGPIDPNAPVVAYANDLSRTVGLPREAEGVASPAGDVSLTRTNASGNPVAFTGQAVISPVTIAPFEFFVIGQNSSDASILIPANHQVARTYRIRMSAYVGSAGAYRRYDYVSLSVTVPAVADITVPLVRVPLAPLLADTTEMQSGSLGGVEPETVRVAPQYRAVTQWTSNASLGNGADYTPIDPFEMKVVDSNLGVLLFSPAARGGSVSRPGGVSEPLLARIDYDVRDWRIIGEDFRVVDQNATYTLGLQSLKVGGGSAPDGLFNGGLFTGNRSVVSDNNSYDPVPTPRDNVVVVDLTTGFEVQRYRTDTKDSGNRTYADFNAADLANVLISVDKSRGSLTFRDADLSGNSSPLDVRLIPPTGNAITVPAANRTFRVLYRARQEWAVQLLKGSSQYSVVNTFPARLGGDQAFVGNTDGGTRRTRLYFAPSETGHKVTIDRVAYIHDDGGAGEERLLEGQDFVVQRGNDPTSFGWIDLVDVDKQAKAFSGRYGVPVRGIKGASVSVRVLWNPETFTLGGNGVANVQNGVNVFNRGWRRSTTETFLRAEETR